MTVMRVVVVSLVLVFAGCFVAPQEACSASNCAGCCDSGGACRTGDSVSACGAAGEACTLCAGGDVCSVGVCTTPATGGGGGGGAATGGGTATGGGGGAGGGSATGGGAADCAVPSALDFGVLGVGAPATQRFTLSNTTATSQTASVNFGGAPGQFRVAPEGVSVIAAGGTLTVEVTLEATVVGAARDALLVRPADACPLSTVQLAGEVRASVLTTTPSTLEFGYVRPGGFSALGITITNDGNTRVQFSSGSASPGGAFSVAPASFSLLPGASQVVMVRFTPRALGPVTGTLSFQTDLPGQPNLDVALRGIGGGPQVQVASALDFGPTHFSDVRTEALLVRNTGTRPTPADPAGNLRFGAPAFEVVPDANTGAGEFSVSLPASYDPSVGLLGGDAVPLLVTFSPASMGPKRAVLRVFTNDQATPVALVQLSGAAHALPPCSLSMTPSGGTIDFGRVRFGRSVPWVVTLTNQLNVACEVYGAGIASGGDRFALEGFTPGTLGPNASMRFTVRFTAPHVATTSVVTHPGSLRISRAGLPDGFVQLSASTGPSCVLTPERIEYGSAPVGCRGAAMGIPLVNTCASNLTVTSGAIASPEFTDFSNHPVSWAGSLIGANSVHPLAFRYRPFDVGRDAAQLVLNVTEGGASVRYVVPLYGEGLAATQPVVETFAPGNNRLSLLFVIDDSCSMAAHQQALANAAAGLFVPSPIGSDLRAGVIVTDLANPQRGVLRRTSSGASFVTRNTPSAGAAVTALMNVGTTGGGAESCVEPAARALSDRARYTASENAGFVTDEDRLAVICVTDAPEQSPFDDVFDRTRLWSSLDTRPLHRFTYNVIGPASPAAPSGCSYDGVDDGQHGGTSERFGGVVEDICTPDLGAALGRVVAHALSDWSFTLQRPVDLAAQPVVVTVDGLSVPELSMGPGGQRNWTFEPSNRRLRFEPHARPSPGSTVSVTYAPMCF